MSPKRGDMDFLNLTTEARMPFGCSMEGCGGRRVARGLCAAHYKRWQIHGDPGVPGIARAGRAMDFLRMALEYEGDECVIWPFATTNGYGVIWMGSDGQQLAHRVICRAKNGPPPSPSHEVAHSCGNGRIGCVCPQHLRWATSKENKDDMVGHGTRIRGERQYHSKLKESDVLEIRGLGVPVSGAELGRRYGVSKSTISNILERRTWGWLK